jgi:hypothetical protein
MFFKNKFLTLAFWANVPAALGLVCYFGNSHSYSDADNTTNNDTTTQEAGFSEVTGDASSSSVDGASNVVTVSTTDHGAVNDAFSFANSVSNRAFDFGDSALDFAGSAMGHSLNANTQAMQVVRDSAANYANDIRGFAESQSTNNDERMMTMVQWMVGAVVVLGGIQMVKGRK